MTTPHYDWIAFHAAYAPASPALEDIDSGRRFTYAEMNERVDRLAGWLQREAGIRPGDRIATLTYNSTDNCELLFAAQRVGAVLLPLNWRLAVPELEFIVNDAGPKVLVYSEALAGAGTEVAQRCGVPLALLKREGEASDYESAIAADLRPAPVPRTLDDDWMLLYTSGTTGRPKGARLTFGNMLFNAVNCAMLAQVTRASKNLVILPQFHVGGVGLYQLPTIHLGGCVAVLRQFDPERCLSLIGDPASGVTHAFGVPTNFLFMSQLPAFRDARFDHLIAGVGGASCPQALLQAYADRGLLIQQGWGMTETATLGTLLSQDRALDKIGSSGRQVLHTSLRIVDPDGNPVAPGEVGELQIKGPTVTPGYWNRPEANAAAFVDGWFRTGDAARKDDEGFYFIVDRWKDMFISGGENVYPAEVENVLYQLGGVAECAVIGIPDAKWGEVGRAFVVTLNGTNLTESAVVAHCRENLAGFKVPKQVRFIDELPHNATGKVTKHMLPRD